MNKIFSIIFICCFCINNYSQGTNKNDLSEKKKKSIDSKVLKIEKGIQEKSLQQIPNWNFTMIDTLIYITKDKHGIKKVNFETDKKPNFVEYSRKCQIYFDNDVPIFITENSNGKYKYDMEGINRKTNQYSDFKFKREISKNIKIYIKNWKKFDVIIINGNQEDYDIKNKIQFDELIKLALTPQKKK
jgi:hypothetical protein